MQVLSVVQNRLLPNHSLNYAVFIIFNLRPSNIKNLQTCDFRWQVELFALIVLKYLYSYIWQANKTFELITFTNIVLELLFCLPFGGNAAAHMDNMGDILHIYSSRAVQLISHSKAMKGLSTKY